MKFKHKASIYQMSTCQIKMYVSLSIKKPKHLCIYKHIFDGGRNTGVNPPCFKEKYQPLINRSKL